jgi:hypothetical protein
MKKYPPPPGKIPFILSSSPKPMRRQVHPVQKNRELSEIIMEINDLREFDRRSGFGKATLP